MMTTRLKCLAPLLALHASACIATAQVAQPTRSAAAALARFEQDAGSPQAVSPVGWNWSLRLASSTVPADSAVVDSVVTGVARLALGSANDRVRARAASFLVATGRAVRQRPVLPRLIHLYRMSADPVVRATMLQGMAGQRPESDAVAFLAQVAVSTPGTVNEDFDDEPWEAVTALAHMGEAGRTALRELRSNGTIRDGKAKGYVEYVARRGYVP